MNPSPLFFMGDFPPGVPTHTSVHNPGEKSSPKSKYDSKNNNKFIGQGDVPQSSNNSSPRPTFNLSLEGKSVGVKKEDNVNEGVLAEVSPVIEFVREQNYGPGSSELHYTFMGHLHIRNIFRPNETSQTLFFKVKTTSPEKFAVNQILGILPASAVVTPKIIIRPDTVLRAVSNERFQVLLMLAPPDLLAQKSLLSKLINRNCEGGTLSTSMSNKLHKMWNNYVTQRVHVETHRVNCVLTNNDYAESNPNPNRDQVENQEPSLPDQPVEENTDFLTPVTSYPPSEPVTIFSREELIGQNKLEGDGYVTPSPSEDLKYSLSNKNFNRNDRLFIKIKSVERRMDDLMHKIALQVCSLKRIIFLIIVSLTVMTLLSYFSFVRQVETVESDTIVGTTNMKNYVGCYSSGGREQSQEVIEGQQQQCSAPTTVKQYATWNRYYV